MVVLWYVFFLILTIIFICYTNGFWKKFISIIFVIISVLAFILGIIGLLFSTSSLGSNYTYIKDCGKYDLIMSNSPSVDGKQTFYFQLYFQGKYLSKSEFISSAKYWETGEQYNYESDANNEKRLNTFDSKNSGLKNTQDLFLECIKSIEN